MACARVRNISEVFQRYVEQNHEADPGGEVGEVWNDSQMPGSWRVVVSSPRMETSDGTTNLKGGMMVRIWMC